MYVPVSSCHKTHKRGFTESAQIVPTIQARRLNLLLTFYPYQWGVLCQDGQQSEEHCFPGHVCKTNTNRVGMTFQIKVTESRTFLHRF